MGSFEPMCEWWTEVVTNNEMKLLLFRIVGCYPLYGEVVKSNLHDE